MPRAKRKPGRPPGNTSDTTRANILSAARTCFARKGFGLTTNQDIAAGAGVSAAAIYQYFDSKLELYVTTANETLAEVIGQMRARVADGGSAATTLSSMVTSLLTVHERDPSLAAFVSTLPSELQRHPEIAKRLKLDATGMRELMTEVLKRAVASGEIEANDALPLAAMFIACMMGLSQYAALVGPGRPPATAFSQLLEGRLFARPLRRSAKPRPRKPGA